MHCTNIKETSSVDARPFSYYLFRRTLDKTDHNESVMQLINNVTADGAALPASYKSLIYI